MSNNRKPTPAQREALDVLATGAYLPSGRYGGITPLVYTPLGGGFMFGININTARALIDHGWIVRTKQCRWVISEAGQAAISVKPTEAQDDR